MKVTEHIYLIGSGRLGFNITDELDCHLFLVTDGRNAAIIDAGGGRNTHLILDEIDSDGIDRASIRQILLTHAHADHAGGANALSQALGAEVFASEITGAYLSQGDERSISVDRARNAGGYPPDYHFSRCDVAGVLRSGDRIVVGSLEIETIESSGHCGGHPCFLLHRPNGTHLFAGDAAFFGGKILLQDIWDCSVSESCRSLERLAATKADGFYPAHGPFSRKRGWVQLDMAMEKLSQLLPPPQFG